MFVTSVRIIVTTWNQDSTSVRTSAGWVVARAHTAATADANAVGQSKLPMGCLNGMSNYARPQPCSRHASGAVMQRDFCSVSSPLMLLTWQTTVAPVLHRVGHI